MVTRIVFAILLSTFVALSLGCNAKKNSNGAGGNGGQAGKGQAGAPCQSGADCANALCARLPSAATQTCVNPCVDGMCADGFRCTQGICIPDNDGSGGTGAADTGGTGAADGQVDTGGQAAAGGEGGSGGQAGAGDEHCDGEVCDAVFSCVERWECLPLESFQVCESLCRLSAEEQDALRAEASCEGVRVILEVEHGLCGREDVCDHLCRQHDCIDETACWNACIEWTSGEQLECIDQAGEDCAEVVACIGS